MPNNQAVKPSWEEEFDKIAPASLETILKYSKFSFDLRPVIVPIKTLIRQTLKETFDEVKGNLPKEKDNDYKDVEDYDIRCQEGVDFDKGYNQCLADIKESIKKTKEKFL